MIRLIPFVLSVPVYLWMATTSRSDFLLFLLQLTILLGLFIVGGHLNRWRLKPGVLIGLAIVFRASMFIDLPQMSDDFYRFVWDGEFAEAGVNPYDYKPSEIKEADLWVTDHFEDLNSPEYYSVYTPIHQSIFVISAKASDTLFGVTTAMRSIFLFVDVLLIMVLIRMFRRSDVKYYVPFVYALFPVVIIEFIGNLHVELLVSFFLVVFIGLMRRDLVSMSSVSYGLAVGLKMLPLIFAPLFVRWWSTKRLIIFGTFLLGLIVVLFSPLLINDRWEHLAQSMGLYFDTFEFNASIYYLVRAAGTEIMGYNPIEKIGPALSLTVMVSTLFVAFRKKVADTSDFVRRMTVVLSIYLFLAAIVHPWYVVPVFVLGLIGGYLYPVVWLTLSMLSYHSYQFADYHEVDVLLFVEYLPVYGLFIYEVVIRKTPLLVTNSYFSRYLSGESKEEIDAIHQSDRAGRG